MQESGARLMARTTLGEDFFARGAPEALAPARRNVIEISLFELLKAYGDFRRRSQAQVLHIEPAELHTVERALSRFRRLLGASTDWESLWRFLPDDIGVGLVAKSAIASTFAAGLELVREQRLNLRQDAAFGPIFLRAAHAPAAPAKIVDGREPEGE
jgi:segregation and condensation protein A